MQSFGALNSKDIQVKVPAICIDLDGVIWVEGNLIEGAKETLQYMAQDLNILDPIRFGNLDAGAKLPFLFVTNGGLTLEERKAEYLNRLIDDIPGKTVSKENFVLNYTPLRDELKRFRNQVVLISGTENYEEIALSCGLNRYVTFSEFAKLYPELWFLKLCSQQERESIRTQVAARLEIALGDLDSILQVHALVFFGDAPNFEQIAQITCDLLSTPDGRIANTTPELGPVSHIPVYTVLPDLSYKGSVPVNRLGFGTFQSALEHIYSLTYKRELRVEKYGKPSKLTADFTLQLAKSNAAKHGLDISNFYMIGDNPSTDIRMGNSMGWTTYLVSTGIFQNHWTITEQQDQPTFRVHNFKEAISDIFLKEKIEFNL